MKNWEKEGEDMEKEVKRLIEVSNERYMAEVKELPVDEMLAKSYETAIWIDVIFTLEDEIERNGVDDALLAFMESTDVPRAVFEEVKGSDSYPDGEYIEDEFNRLLDAFILTVA